MPKKFKSSISIQKSVKSSKIHCKLTYESKAHFIKSNQNIVTGNQSDYSQLFELINSMGSSHVDQDGHCKKFSATITRDAKYIDEDDVNEDHDHYLDCLSHNDSVRIKIDSDIWSRSTLKY